MRRYIDIFTGCFIHCTARLKLGPGDVENWQGGPGQGIKQLIRKGRKKVRILLLRGLFTL